MDPDVNVEESVLKSALQGTEVEEYYHPDMHCKWVELRTEHK